MLRETPGPPPSLLCLLSDSRLPGFAESRFPRRAMSILLCSGLRTKEWVRVTDRGGPGTIRPETLPSRVRPLPSSPTSRSEPQEAACLRSWVVTRCPEVMARSSAPQAQLRAPRRRAALSAAPPSWLCSAPRVRASSGTAWCWKTWPTL